MNRAKVQLVNSISLAIGDYRFEKNKPVIVDNVELLKYCKGSSNFNVEPLGEERKVRIRNRPNNDTEMEDAS
jgi:hypothetical protein